MRNRILEKLEELENQHAVRVLYAVESGSRAWGMESINSDYDVRFIYVHEPAWYLSLSPRRDVIEEMVTEFDLDLVGWELRKAVSLLLKGNPVLQEWLSSGVVYRPNPAFVSELLALLRESPRRMALLHHYRGIASKTYAKRIHGKESVRVKSYLYTIRPILQYHWVRGQQGRFEALPPIAVPELLDAVDPPKAVRNAITGLLTDKKNDVETKTVPSDLVLNAYIKHALSEFPTCNPSEHEPVRGFGVADWLLTRVILERAYCGEDSCGA